MRDSDVQKPPGIAEAIDWVAALSLLGVESLDAARDRPDARLGAQVRRGPGGDPRGRPGASSCAAVADAAAPAFGVETIDLDLPALAGAFGRRLHRSRRADDARAAGRPRPRAGARAPDQPPAAVLDGTRRARQRSHACRRLRPRLPRRLRRSPVRRELRPRRGPHRRHRRAARRPAAGRASDRERRAGRDPGARSVDGEGADHGPEVEVPVAMASEEERLARKSFDALEPFELAQLYRLMTRLRARDARGGARAATRRGATASTSTCAVRCAPACAPAATRSASRAAGGASPAAGW